MPGFVTAGAVGTVAAERYREAVEPLVEPGPPLTAAQADTYARHLLLPEIGEVGQRRLLAARVCVVGAGGLGSPALLYLAAAGVGTLAVIDDDDVEVSNLQRQVLHGVADVGASKRASAVRRLRDLAPEVRVVPEGRRLTRDNAVDLLRGYHLVLDGTDTFETRYAVADACAELGTPLVWGSVLGFDAQVAVFWPQAPGGVTLRDLFPTPPPAGSVPSCAEAGVLGSLTGQVGSTMATEAIKLIVGIGEPLLGRVLALDGLRQRWAEVPLLPRTGEPTASLPQPGPERVRPDEPHRPETIAATELRDLLALTSDVTVLDVRDPAEVALGAIPGALHLPLARLMTEHGRAAVPHTGTVVTYCSVGPRAERAAAILQADGVRALPLRGGYPAWQRAAATR